MKVIEINNSGIFERVFNDNLNQLELIEVIDINKYYDANVILSNDLIYGSFLNNLFKYKDKINEDFVSYTRGFLLDNYIIELNKPIDSSESDINFIEMYYVNDVHKRYDIIEDKHETTQDNYSSFHGVGIDGTNYGLSFTPLNKLKNHLFKLSENYDLCIYDLENNADVITYKISGKVWSLYELISSFLSELTFYGYPEDREETEKEIFGSIDIDKNEDDYIAYEDLQISWLEDDLKDCQENENYEACERIKNKITKLKQSK